MKHFFLYGDFHMNAGPQNVNRSLVMNSDNSMVYAKAKHRILRRIEKLYKGLCCSTIVISAGFKRLDIKLFKLFGKRIVYIMHGCAQYENRINKLGYSEKSINNESWILNIADVIAAVSENYAKWVKHKFPQHANKVIYVNNGLEITSNFCLHKPHANGNFSIAVSGGNLPIKCNLEVCKAVEILTKEGMTIEIKAFGNFRDNGEPISKYPFVKKMGQMDKDSYYAELRITDLFVVASDIESFGLVVGDAVNCGCSLLMSKHVGAINIFNDLKPEDILNDNHDIREIADKIKYLLLHSNAKRLFYAVDAQRSSGKQSFINLKNICLDEQRL